MDLGFVIIVMLTYTAVAVAVAVGFRVMAKAAPRLIRQWSRMAVRMAGQQVENETLRGHRSANFPEQTLMEMAGVGSKGRQRPIVAVSISTVTVGVTM